MTSMPLITMIGSNEELPILNIAATHSQEVRTSQKVSVLKNKHWTATVVALALGFAGSAHAALRDKIRELRGSERR